MTIQDRRPESAGDGHDARNGHARAHVGDESLLTAWRRIRARVPELERHLHAYASVQIDRARLSLRRLVLRVVIGLLAGVAALTATITAAAMLAAGIGEGLAALFGGKAWLGHALGGLAVLGLLGGLIAFAYGRRRRRDQERLRRRYASAPAAAETQPVHVEFEPQGPEL